MIQTAAIIWAVLVTPSWAFEVYRGRLLKRQIARREEVIAGLSAGARDLYSQLFAIHQRRHEAAKKARAAQLAQRAALVASTTEQIRKEIGR